MPSGAAQAGRVMVERSDRMWSTGEYHVSILALRTDEEYEISGEITPETMKGWSQSKDNIQLWMELVIEARFDAVKSNIA